MKDLLVLVAWGVCGSDPFIQIKYIIIFFIKTILKAERWARDNGLPFPQIEGNPVLEDPEFKECYVFEDPTNPECPTILHFPLVNKTFKEFSEPGKKYFCFTRATSTITGCVRMACDSLLTTSLL